MLMPEEARKVQTTKRQVASPYCVKEEVLVLIRTDDLSRNS